MLVIALTAVTDARNRDYASEEGLWRDTVQKRPQNPRAHNNYGIDLLRKGDVTTAERHFRSAVALDPRFAERTSISAWRCAVWESATRASSGGNKRWC